MKKKILGLTAILAIIALATLNISITNADTNKIDLDIIKTQAFADGEWGGWSNFFQGQGFYKDEKVEKRVCSSSQSSGANISVIYKGVTVGAGFHNSQTNPPDRYETVCGYGYENCTKIPC
ncbi:MAG: hypothetical protein JG782_1093 [Anaerophaga sp.]|nr:hypothetical protein [Anaerophaga sp.]MDI3520599.1 hypothetical protein [Anaerophaga sp.]MDK2841888.1 hypothetical protein [Anaerophaga sp.]MDN5290559.1 hypothetical protein [Anaerophaga sp.]